MSPRQGKTYAREPGRHLSDWRAQMLVPHPSLVPSERAVQDEFYGADRMRDKLEPAEAEEHAVEVAAEYVGTNVSTLAVLTWALYGVEPDELRRKQSRRTDGLLRLTWYVAREEGYEAAWRTNPTGKSAGARQAADPPEQMEAA